MLISSALLAAVLIQPDNLTYRYSALGTTLSKAEPLRTFGNQLTIEVGPDKPLLIQAPMATRMPPAANVAFQSAILKLTAVSGRLSNCRVGLIAKEWNKWDACYKSPMKGGNWSSKDFEGLEALTLQGADINQPTQIELDGIDRLVDKYLRSPHDFHGLVVWFNEPLRIVADSDPESNMVFEVKMKQETQSTGDLTFGELILSSDADAGRTWEASIVNHGQNATSAAKLQVKLGEKELSSFTVPSLKGGESFIAKFETKKSEISTIWLTIDNPTDGSPYNNTLAIPANAVAVPTNASAVFGANNDNPGGTRLVNAMLPFVSTRLAPFGSPAQVVSSKLLPPFQSDLVGVDFRLENFAGFTGSSQAAGWPVGFAERPTNYQAKFYNSPAGLIFPEYPKTDPEAPVNGIPNRVADLWHSRFMALKHPSVNSMMLHLVDGFGVSISGANVTVLNEAGTKIGDGNSIAGGMAVLTNKEPFETLPPKHYALNLSYGGKTETRMLNGFDIATDLLASNLPLYRTQLVSLALHGELDTSQDLAQRPQYPEGFPLEIIDADLKTSSKNFNAKFDFGRDRLVTAVEIIWSGTNLMPRLATLRTGEDEPTPYAIGSYERLKTVTKPFTEGTQTTVIGFVPRRARELHFGLSSDTAQVHELRIRTVPNG